jgi:hypothetical protein
MAGLSADAVAGQAEPIAALLLGGEPPDLASTLGIAGPRVVVEKSGMRMCCHRYLR